MSETIFVAGATGTIGSRVVAHLAARSGVSVRAGVRRHEHLAPQSNVTPVAFDYDDVPSIERALAGADRLFLLTPVTDSQVAQGQRMIDAARRARVRHVVKLSALGSEVEPGIQLGRWHRAIERALEAADLPHTLVRANNFQSNFIAFHPPQADGNIYLPWGDGACSFIAPDDVGAVVAEALTGRDHIGKTYELTGPAALTIAEAAATIGEVTGRRIGYVDVPESSAREGMRSAGLPSWMVEAMMELHAIDKAGYAAAVTPTVSTLLGRPATSFRTFVEQNRAKLLG